MKRTLKNILAALACLLAPVSNMANAEGAGIAPAARLKEMLLTLLGLGADADDTAINTRYEEAMKAEPDDDAKKLAELEKQKSALANEKANAVNAKIQAETQAANEKAARTEAEVAKAKADEDLKVAKESFANERKERVKLLLDAAVTGNKITGAKRTEYEVEFANEGKFDETLAKLAAEKGTSLPSQRQAGMANIGSRKVGLTPEASKRQEKVTEMVNEEIKKPVYSQLEPGARYSKAFAAVQRDHPELWAD